MRSTTLREGLHKMPSCATPRSAFPAHSTIRTPHSTFRIPHSAFRTLGLNPGADEATNHQITTSPNLLGLISIFLFQRLPPTHHPFLFLIVLMLDEHGLPAEIRSES